MISFGTPSFLSSSSGSYHNGQILSSSTSSLQGSLSPKCTELLLRIANNDLEGIIQILSHEKSTNNTIIGNSTTPSNGNIYDQQHQSNIFNDLFKTALFISRENLTVSEKDELIQHFTSILRCLLLFDKTRKKSLNFVYDLLTSSNIEQNYAESFVDSSASCTIELSGRLIMSVISEVHSSLYHFRHTTSVLTLEQGSHRKRKTYSNGNDEDEESLLVYDEEDMMEANIAQNNKMEKQKIGNILQHNPGSELLGVMLLGANTEISSSALNSSILYILKDLKEFTNEKIELMLSSNNRRHTANVNGNIAFLELIPVMITTCKTLADQLSISQNFQEKTDTEIISFILEKQWKPEYFISLLNIFLDVKIDESSNFHVCIIKKIQTAPRNLEISGIVQVLLKLAEQYNSQGFSNLEYIQVIKTVFSKTSTNIDSRLNLYYIIQSALQYSLPLLNIVLKAMDQFYEVKPVDVNKCSFSEHFVDFMILLLAYKNELVKDKVFTHINKFIHSIYKHVTPQNQNMSDAEPFFSPGSKKSFGSSSTSILDHDVIEMTDTYYVETIIKSACNVNIVSEEMLSILGEWCRMNNRMLNTIGKSGIVFLFSACEGSRSTILQKIIGSIAEENQVVYLRETPIAILEALLAEERAFAFCSIIERLYDYLSTFDQYSYAVSSRILLAILPISEVSDYIRGELLAKLEKICVDDKREKIGDKRKLAIFGLSMLLSMPSYQQDQVTILTALQNAFRFNDMDMKMHLYKSLSNSLMKVQSSINGQISQEACEILFHMLKSKLLNYFTMNKDRGIYNLEIEKCFELVSEDGKYRQQEPLEELFKCFALLDKVLKKQNSDLCGSLYSKLFESLVENIRDIEWLCKILTIHEDSEQSSISANERLNVIIPLIQVLIEERFQQTLEVDEISVELLEINSLLQRMEKKMSKRKVKGNYLTFNTCKSLCSELCNKISKETTQQWSKSLLITLTSVIDHVTYYAGECKEKLSNSLLKIITRKRLDEVEVLGTERQTSLSMIRIIRTLFDIFISFYKDENSQKTRLRLKKSELVQKFEDHIERSSPYWKSLTQDSSIFEKVRMKILNLITVYFEGVKLSGSEEFTENSSLEKLLKFMFNEQHIQETLTQEIPNTTEEQEENLELHMKPLDFITMTFYFSKLLYMEKNKNPRGCSTYLKLIKTFAGIHPFVVSMGIPFEPRQDQNDDMSTSSSEDDDTSDIVSPLSMDPRLRKCCLMIELLIMNELKSVSSALFVKEILMFLLNFSSVSTSLDYCKDTIVSCIEVCKTSSNESTTRRNDSASRSFHISMCNMANIIKTRECSSKALAVILSYVELITVKMNEQFKKKGASQGSTSNRRTEIFNVSSTFSERARKNQHAHLILPGSIFVKIKECLSAGVKLVHGEYAEFGSTDSVTSKLDKIMTGLCNYVINSSIAFKKKIKKNLDRSTSALIIECSASFQSVFDTISNVMSLRGSISTAKNNMEVDLTKNYTKLEQAMEKMCFEIRELNRAYKNRNKKAKLQRLVIIEELTKYRLINEDMTTHNDEENEEATQKRKKAGSSSTSKRRKKNLVLRSKNKYIDHALCVEDEDYHDIHADLEDWIDDDNWEPAY